MKRLFLLLTLALAFITGCCSSHYNINESPSTRTQLINHLNKSSVVLMMPDFEDGVYRSVCTGVWISRNQILSASHCAESVLEEDLKKDESLDRSKLPGVVMAYKDYSDAEKVYKLAQGEKSPNFAIVVSYTSHADLILLEVIGKDLNHEIASFPTSKPKIGDDVVIVGHTVGMPYTFMTGTIANEQTLTPFEEPWKLWAIASFVGPGNSGGAAFDLNGNILGICSFGNRRASGVSFFVHLDVIKEFLQKK